MFWGFIVTLHWQNYTANGVRLEWKRPVFFTYLHRWKDDPFCPIRLMHLGLEAKSSNGIGALKFCFRKLRGRETSLRSFQIWWWVTQSQPKKLSFLPKLSLLLCVIYIAVSNSLGWNNILEYNRHWSRNWNWTGRPNALVTFRQETPFKLNYFNDSLECPWPEEKTRSHNKEGDALRDIAGDICLKHSFSEHNIKELENVRPYQYLTQSNSSDTQKNIWKIPNKKRQGQQMVQPAHFQL